MVQSLSWLRALAVAGSIGLALSACASRPKPMGPAATAAPMPPPPPPRADDGRAVGDEGVTEGDIPGSARDFVIKAGDLVYFDFDRFEVRAEARAVLDLQAAWLERYPSVHVRIEGNTDSRGTREYNFALGARRANAVRDYLVQRGVDSSRIETVSYGKEHPLDTSSGDKADAINRNARTVVTGGARGG
jgi:peptidoglycan-associated lipoprotein